MKTKPFLLATAGSTVDGRVIDDKMLTEMASSYDPKTYGARLNIEHIRGISGQAPFRAYGDVVELSIGETDVNFNGKTEKRKALFGTFDVTDEAKQLNAEGQKVYPSIEIEPNFAGKGHAYLMGCALTDSPASIATERLSFNRQMPGTIHLSRGEDGQPTEPAALEFADLDGSDTGDKFLSKLFSGLEGIFGKSAPAKADPQPQIEGDKPQVFTAADLQGVLEKFGQNIGGEITSQLQSLRGDLDQFAVKLGKVEKAIENTPAAAHTPRPDAVGANGKYAVTDC